MVMFTSIRNILALRHDGFCKNADFQSNCYKMKFAFFILFYYYYYYWTFNLFDIDSMTSDLSEFQL